MSIMFMDDAAGIMDDITTYSPGCDMMEPPAMMDEESLDMDTKYGIKLDIPGIGHITLDSPADVCGPDFDHFHPITLRPILNAKSEGECGQGFEIFHKKPGPLLVKSEYENDELLGSQGDLIQNSQPDKHIDSDTSSTEIDVTSIPGLEAQWDANVYDQNGAAISVHQSSSLDEFHLGSSNEFETDEYDSVDSEFSQPGGEVPEYDSVDSVLSQQNGAVSSFRESPVESDLPERNIMWSGIIVNERFKSGIYSQTQLKQSAKGKELGLADLNNGINNLEKPASSDREFSPISSQKDLLLQPCLSIPDQLMAEDGTLFSGSGLTANIQAEINGSLMLAPHVILENTGAVSGSVTTTHNTQNDKTVKKTRKRPRKDSTKQKATKADEPEETVEFTCVMCCQPFTIQEQLEKHFPECLNKWTMFCDRCGRGFVNRQAKVLHRRTHERENPYKCYVCKKSFKFKCHYSVHMNIHEQKLQSCCEICGREFAYMSNLAKHLKLHAKDKPYKCKHCKQNFTSFGMFRRHMKLHTTRQMYAGAKGAKKLKKICDENASDNIKMKPYSCVECDAEFMESAQAKCHMEWHEAQGQQYECQQCGQSFNHLRVFVEHLISQHKVDVKNMIAQTIESRNFAHLGKIQGLGIDFTGEPLSHRTSTDLDSEATYMVPSHAITNGVVLTRMGLPDVDAANIVNISEITGLCGEVGVVLCHPEEHGEIGQQSIPGNVEFTQVAVENGEMCNTDSVNACEVEERNHIPNNLSLPDITEVNLSKLGEMDQTANMNLSGAISVLSPEKQSGIPHTTQISIGSITNVTLSAINHAHQLDAIHSVDSPCPSDLITLNIIQSDSIDPLQLRQGDQDVESQIVSDGSSPTVQAISVDDNSPAPQEFNVISSEPNSNETTTFSALTVQKNGEITGTTSISAHDLVQSTKMSHNLTYQQNGGIASHLNTTVYPKNIEITSNFADVSLNGITEESLETVRLDNGHMTQTLSIAADASADASAALNSQHFEASNLALNLISRPPYSIKQEVDVLPPGGKQAEPPGSKHVEYMQPPVGKQVEYSSTDEDSDLPDRREDEEDISIKEEVDDVSVDENGANIEYDSDDDLWDGVKSENGFDDFENEPDIYKDEKPYKCSVCGQSYKSPSSLERHVKVHLKQQAEATQTKEPQPYQCGVCGMEFRRAWKLGNHMVSVHSLEVHGDLAFNASKNRKGRPKEALSDSRKVYPEGKGFVSTTRRTHPDPKDSLSCVLCRKHFRAQRDLTYHSPMCHQERPHRCMECGRGFKDLRDCKRHMRTHTGELPYKCSVCKRAFSQSGNLMRHMKTHGGENLFRCAICDMSFAQPSILASHCSLHSDADRKKLAKGQMQATSDIDFGCILCGKDFKSQVTLTRHMKKKH